MLLNRKKRTKPSPMLEYGRELSIEIIGKIHEVYPEIEKISDHKYDLLEKSLSKFMALRAEEIAREAIGIIKGV